MGATWIAVVVGNSGRRFAPPPAGGAPFASVLSIPSLSYTTGQSVSAVIPVVFSGGGRPYNITVSPPIPGLTVRSSDGQINAGTAGAVTAAQNYRFTGLDAFGATTFKDVSITINAASSGLATGPGQATGLGLTQAEWDAIVAQQTAWGDPNTGLQAKINSLPTTGFALADGGNINSAIASNNVVILTGGTYRPTSRISYAGKQIIGAPGTVNTIVGDLVDIAVTPGNNAVLANVIISNANGDGVNTYHAPTDSGSVGALIYGVSVQKTGYYATNNDGSSGIRVSQGAHNCAIVSCEAFHTWNDIGGSNANGGNSDGINNSFDAVSNTFIDIHSYQNGDDGIDCWHGGTSFWYKINSHDNAKVPGRTNGGNGNGFKLGESNALQRVFRGNIHDNSEGGFVRNSSASYNTPDPVLVQTTSVNNPLGNYLYFFVQPS